MTRTHYIYIAFTLLAMHMPAGAQDVMRLRPRYEAVLQSVARNNTALKVAAKQNEAQLYRLQASRRLQDPEAEVAWLAGSPKGVPNRTNVTVTQQLDWGVLTGRRGAAAKAGEETLALRLAAENARVLAAADRALVELVYRNKLCVEMRLRASAAREVETVFEKRYARGDASLPDLNKARLAAAVARADERRAESARAEAESELSRLAGGADVAYPDTLYATAGDSLPPLQVLLALAGGGAAVRLAEGEARQSKAEGAVARAEAWPTLTAGFMGEYIKGNNYSGASVGFSLPLWGGGRKRARQKAAEAAAWRIGADGTRRQLAGDVARQYRAAADLLLAQAQLAAGIAAADNTALLRRSLEEGRITLLDYLTESTLSREARVSWLETEHDAQAALARLRSLLR